MTTPEKSILNIIRNVDLSDEQKAVAINDAAERTINDCVKFAKYKIIAIAIFGSFVATLLSLILITP